MITTQRSGYSCGPYRRGPGHHEHSSIPSRKDSMVVNVAIRADRIYDLDMIKLSLFEGTFKYGGLFGGMLKNDIN